MVVLDIPATSRTEKTSAANTTCKLLNIIAPIPARGVVTHGSAMVVGLWHALICLLGLVACQQQFS